MRHDSFTNAAQQPLHSEAWTFDTVRRYDPTRCEGLTPSGKSYVMECRGGTCTLTIAGRAKSAASTTYADPASLLETWRALYNSFPRAQQ